MRALIVLLSLFSITQTKLTSWSANYIHANDPYYIQLLATNIKDSVGKVSVLLKLKHEDSVVSQKHVVVTYNKPHFDKIVINPIKDASNGASLTLEYSYQENGEDVSLRGTVIYVLTRSSILIQTDKPIYKPGETMKFRGFMVDRDLKPVDESFDIYVINPNNTRIMRWENVKTSKDFHIFEDEFKISKIPTFGEWNVRVEGKLTNVINHKTFKVDRYVLPKFAVTVTIDKSYITKADREISGHVECMYTFGEACIGKVDVELSFSMEEQSDIRPLQSPEFSTVMEINGELNDQGKFRFNFHVKALRRENFFAAGNLKGTVEIKADVIESGTNIVQSGSNSIAFADSDFLIKFSDAIVDSFKPGLDFELILDVTLPDGKPLSTVDDYKDVKIDICAKFNGKCFHKSQESIIGTRSTTSFQVKRKEPAKESSYERLEQLQIVASITFNGKTTSASKGFDQFSTKSKSYCSIDTPRKEGDEVKMDVTFSQKCHSIVYQIIARSEMISVGEVKLAGLTGSLTLIADPSWSPYANLVVSCIVGDDPEVVACATTVNSTNPFSNQATVSFDKSIVEPGENVKLTVSSSDSDFIAGVLAVDESIRLLAGAENDINIQQVMSAINSMSTHDPRKIENHCFKCGFLGINGKTSGDVYDNSEILVITNCQLLRFYPLLSMPLMMRENILFKGDLHEKTDSFGTKKSVSSRKRSFFPESWIWLLQKSRSVSREIVIPLKAPDTITKWVASAFVISKKNGLGIALNTAELITVKKFFIRLNLPYSVKRDEEFRLSVSVFNYLGHDVKYSVLLETFSKDFQVIQSENSSVKPVSKQGVLSSGRSTTVFYPLVSKRIGNLEISVCAFSSTKSVTDKVVQPIKVVPEGIRISKSTPFVVNLSNISSQIKTFDLNAALPSNYVADSDFCKISISGDVMGNTISNLDGMIQKPFGCGEQTMIILAPMVYTVNYLQKSNKLETNTKIKQKAFDYMKDGYQRELTFQHPDNSFSAFGESDKHGSTWLTSFVVKVFSELSELLFIDSTVVEGAIIWLNTQMEDGHFIENGNVCHREMQSDTVSMLTPYVVIAINSVPEDLIAKFSETGKMALQNMKDTVKTPLQSSNTNGTYAMVLKAIALQGLKVNIDAIILEIERRAVDIYQDGDLLRYWQHKKPEKIDQCTDFCRKAPSAEVELTAYVLLLLINAGKPLQQLLPIQKWLVSQQNNLGGYSSTQDTIIALQALSSYIDNQVQTNMQVKVEHQDAVIENRLVENTPIVYITEFSNIAGILKLAFEGKGRLSATITVSYNEMKTSGTKRLNVAVREVLSTEKSNRFEVCVIDFDAKKEPLGMVIVTMDMLSGLDFDVNNAVINSTDVQFLKKIERHENSLVMYFDTLSSRAICYFVQLARTSKVAAIKPATITVEDYYNSENTRSLLYTSSTLKKSKLAESRQ